VWFAADTFVTRTLSTSLSTKPRNSLMNKKLAISTLFFAMLLFAGFAAAAEMVNLNKATAAAIQQNLVGIGPIKAEAIISYRKKNGKFKSLDDLQNVTGIGPALVKKNKRYLSLTKGVVAGDNKAYAASKKQAGKSKSTGIKKKSKVAAKTSKKDSKVKGKTDTKTTSKSKKKTSKTKKSSKESKPTKKSSSKKKPAKKKKKTSKSTT